MELRQTLLYICHRFEQKQICGCILTNPLHVTPLRPGSTFIDGFSRAIYQKIADFNSYPLRYYFWKSAYKCRAGTQRLGVWWIRRDTPISSLLLGGVVTFNAGTVMFIVDCCWKVCWLTPHMNSTNIISESLSVKKLNCYVLNCYVTVHSTSVQRQYASRPKDIIKTHAVKPRLSGNKTNKWYTRFYVIHWTETHVQPCLFLFSSQRVTVFIWKNGP